LPVAASRLLRDGEIKAVDVIPRSVLIVEDDSRFSETFASAIEAADDLQLAGMACDVAQGLTQLNALSPDVMLVDLGLPDGSGLDLIRHAAVKHPNCETMVVTVFQDEASILQSICAGATGYLLKEERAINIVKQIRRLCDGGSPISPCIARRLIQELSGRESGDKPSIPTPLSRQEASVLAFSAKGYASEEIAELMGISYHTVETYIKRIYRKLQVHSKTQAIHEALALGLINP
jgi:DNA-binding NarL/FixJ family response regulator